MAWFGDSLSSLSNLKGQITNFTKEVLSEGIVEEVDERSKALNEANERCSKLQDLLNTKDAEISLLRRQNCELQRTVIEINAKSKESDTKHIDESEAVFWDPSCVYNRNARNQNPIRQLQEQLAQATVRVRELECELKRMQKVNNASLRDDIPDAHQKAEVLRAKQDLMNRIIKMEEKNREAERNARRIQLDESSLINDFRSVISKLDFPEKFDLLSGALRALQIESGIHEKIKDHEKLDSDEKFGNFECNPLALKYHIDENLEQRKTTQDKTEGTLINKEEMLHKRIKILENENKDLLDSMEKLDEEHTQSIEKLLSIKEETDKKHRCLQNAYEQLCTDYNEAQKKIIILENNGVQSKLDKNTSTEINYQFVQADNVGRLEKHVQTMSSIYRDNMTSETNILDDITQKVKKILKNYTMISIESEKSIFETIAEQYVDTRWKLDVLERKVTEITRNLKETEEMKDSLQMECEEMQSHIDSLLLENQALKSSLPSIPEASEERVACLETDVEYLHEEVKRLLAENDIMRKTNADLMSTVQSKEISLRQHEGSEVISKKIQCNTSISIKDNDILQEDVNWEVHLPSKKNEKLQQNVELRADTKEHMREEFQTSLGNRKNLNEDVIPIEQLYVDRENAKQALHPVYKTELLENIRRNSTNESIQENTDMLRKKKQLMSEFRDWQESDLRSENDCLLLQKQLDKANGEKSELQNNILCKNEELDEIRIQIDIKQSQIAKLCQDNDRLIKENISLSEQLTATHDESLDKIELLNTEMTLLQQEHEDLKQEASVYKEELADMNRRLNETQEHYIKMENEYSALKMQCEQFKTEKENCEIKITEKIMRIDELEAELTLKESSIAELNMVQNKCKFLEQELEAFRAKESQLSEFQEDIAGISSLKSNNTNKKAKEEYRITEDSLDKAEEIVEYVEMKKQSLLTKDMNIMSNDNENPTFESSMDDKRRQKDITSIRNEQLMAEVIELRTNLRTTVENNKDSADMAKQTIEDLSHLVREKDAEMSALQTEVIRANGIITQTSNELATIRNQRDQLEQLIAVKRNENLQQQNEIQELIRHMNVAHIQSLIVEQTANASTLKNKNADVSKIPNVEERLVERSTQRDEIAVLNENCEALEAALRQEQSNNRILQNQLMESQNKEINAAKELERLRSHLVEMESSYTEEAIIAEKNRQELEARLLQTEEKMKNSSTAYVSANIRANQQVETLQQQIALITQQRDHIQTKLSAAEDNILLQAASLTNLQIVLEQFQQDKESDIISVTEKIRSQLNDSHKKQGELVNEISILKQQLSEAKECLQAASRLSEQLEKKDEQIGRFNEEVARLTSLVNTAEKKVKETMENDEGKVDKILIKNLLLGYLSSTTSDKSSILRVFATILDFTESEKDKTGLSNAMAQSRLLRPASNNSNASLNDQEASLSTAFVRFLESESKPKPQLPALPILNSPSSRSGSNKYQSSSSSTQSTLLLSNVTLPTFPDFIPARNTGSILKEVLKDS